MTEYKDGRGDYYLAAGIRETRADLKKWHAQLETFPTTDVLSHEQYDAYRLISTTDLEILADLVKELA